MSGRVLVVDDDVAMCELLDSELTSKGFTVRWTTSATAALDLLAAIEVDAIVTDLNMRSMNGLAFCERIVANRSDIPVLVITAFGSLETAVAAIRVGAYDFLTKPFEVDTLALGLERAVQHRALRNEVKRLRRAVERMERFDELLGASQAMQSVYDLLEQLVQTDATVLVTGESGTGKELVARALHRRGARSDGPLVAFNCAAMPESLIENELFGHARGAFTDAGSQRVGLFVRANGGTLLLDEIGEMPLALQAKLLRALQERTVRPLGSNAEVPFDVRLIATTNRDLESAIEDGRFREDLFFRINVLHVHMPPLRARGSDVLLLAQHFVDRHMTRSNKHVSGITPAAAERLLAYAWPGNVRELYNCIERAVALTPYEQIAVDDLPERIRNYRAWQLVIAGDDPSELLPLEEIERRYILRVVEATAGNKTLAAQILRLDRKTLYRKLERWGQKSGQEGEAGPVWKPD